MKNLKIRNKILLPMLFLMAIVTAASVLQLMGMAEINKQSTIISEDLLPRIEKTMSMNLEFSSYRRSHFAFLLSQTPEQDAHYVKRMAGFAEKLEEKAKNYNAMIRPDQDEQRKYFDQFMVEWANYKKLAQQSFDMKAQGNVIGASDLVMKTGIKTYDSAVEAIGKIVEVNERNAANASAAGDKEFSNNKLIAIGLIVGLFALGLFIVFTLVKAVASPIKKITDYMNYLAAGNLDKDVPSRELKDEVGDMARAIQIFKDNMVRAKELEATEIAERKAKEVRQQKVDAATNKFELAMQEIVKFVASASSELQAAAQSLSATAEETSKQSGAVAAASQQATANVQTVASASEELTASIDEIASQVSLSSSVASQAVKDARDAGAKVAELVEAAQRIGDVTKLISGIAEQTNLLALNATIEAARAGEAGKGFAVVASEVKNLANESAKATEEISNKIAEIQTISQSSAEAINMICKVIEEIDGIAGTIAGAIQEQTAATQEISRNVSEAYTGTSEVTMNITSVSDAANSTGASSQQVLSAANELAKQSNVLKVEFDDFIRSVAAA